MQRELQRKIVELKPKKGVVGMATGTDMWSGWIFVKVGVPFIAACPYQGQERKWREDQQRSYRDLLSKADELLFLYDPPTSDRDAAEKLQKRNEWMVDNSDVLLAVWDGVRKGGTWNCIKYAEKVGRPWVRIDPMEFAVGRVDDVG